jgi:hypothetical protein
VKKTKNTDNKKRGKLKRILKYMLLVLVILLVLNTVPAFFYSPETNTNPLPSSYLKGVYHMHSIFSDGKGTIDEITQAAASLNLDFVILTDHGRPNLQSSTCSTWLNNVLLIGGSEFSLNCGHLAAMGFKIPDYIFPPEPQEAIDEVISDKGVCFISHPFDDKVPWTDWDISRFTGLEVLSSYSEARRAGILKILIFPLKYLINSKYALLNTMGYPTENIKKWDSLNQSGQYYGIYALDAHAKLPISKKIQLNFPTYQSMFEIMTVYIKLNQKLLYNIRHFDAVAADTVHLKKPSVGPKDLIGPPCHGAPGRRRQAHKAAAAVISSLRKGNFFNVIEGIASANGFEAFFIEKNSGKRIEMGGSSKEKQGKLVILLPFNFETETIIFKNGTRSEQKANKHEKQLEFDINEPGVYRIEVYLPGNTFDELPWIMTNPFFIGVEAPLPSSPEKDEIVLKRPLPDAPDTFRVEKNSRSEGVIDYQTTEEGETITHFTFKLVKESPQDQDFWSVIALRKRFDFSADLGFIFEAGSDKKRRFWVEFRTGEGESEVWYRHSFLLEQEWKKFHIPFKKFQVIYGEKKALKLSEVRSIFFSINNANAYPGTEGEIFLKNIGIY